MNPMNPEEYAKAIEEYRRLEAAYDPMDRLEKCGDPDGSVLARIEIDFAVPIVLTQDHQRRLLTLIDEIIDAPINQPKEGLHWMSGVGSKPHWSRADCAVLSKTPEADAPATGEPTFDDSILHIESCARSFGSDRERDRVRKQRNQA